VSRPAIPSPDVANSPSKFLLLRRFAQSTLARMTDESMALEIAEPCPAAWDEMSGAGQRRHCEECGKTVHDISALAPAAAADLIAGAAQSGICVRVRCDRDGFVLHDAPTPPRRTDPRLRLLSPAVLATMAACSGPPESALVVEGPGFTAPNVQYESLSGRTPSALPGALVPTAGAAPGLGSQPPAHRANVKPEQRSPDYAADPPVRHVMGAMAIPEARPRTAAPFSQ
jgi:hypothetical protein